MLRDPVADCQYSEIVNNLRNVLEKCVGLLFIFYAIFQLSFNFSLIRNTFFGIFKMNFNVQKLL